MADNPASAAMDCKRAQLLINAYLDGELDLSGSLELEAHLAECPNCRAQQEELARLGRRLRGGLANHVAPEDLRARLEQMTTQVRHPAPTTRARASAWPRRPLLALAASVLIAIFASGGTTYLLMQPASQDAVAAEVVASHIRSLMADHLVDVVSSDQHTVKPWFDGRLDLAPAVIDLKAEGFPLVGGRLDYIDGQPVAAIIYRRGKHLINVFAWPRTETKEGPVRALTVRGYNLVTWTSGDLTYWAVSDVNAKDLATLQRLIAQGAPATPE
jgi:anti-sigma factor RsiW